MSCYTSYTSYLEILLIFIWFFYFLLYFCVRVLRNIVQLFVLKTVGVNTSFNYFVTMYCNKISIILLYGLSLASNCGFFSYLEVSMLYSYVVVVIFYLFLCACFSQYLASNILIRSREIELLVCYMFAALSDLSYLKIKVILEKFSL